MIISNVQTGDICKIKLDGALLIDAVAKTKDAVTAALGRNGTVELDVSDVCDCDTAGAQLLLMLRAEARVRGRAFTMTPLSPPALRSAERIGLVADAFAIKGS